VPLVSDPVVNQVLTKKPETKKEESKEEKKDVAVAEKPKAKSTRQAAPAKVDPATQTESEKEFEQTVAAQAAAVNAISFVPGFSAYQNAIIPDTNALVMQRQYNKPTVDNARAMRQLNGASDRLHQQMIDEQYR
jgi:outer membrane biosynthesis protein TonB